MKKILGSIGCIWRVGIYYVILFCYYIIGVLGVACFSMKENTSLVQLLEKTVLFFNENTSFFYVLISILSIISYYFLFIRKKDKLNENSERAKTKKDVALLAFSFGMAAAMIVNMVYNIIYWNDNGEMIEVSLCEFVVYFLGTVVLAPFIEELLFRKMLFTRLKNYISVRNATIVSSLLFGLMHGEVFDFIYTFIIGIILSILYDRFRKIIYPMLMHIGFNLMAVLIQTVEIYSSRICLVVIGIGFVVCIFTWYRIALADRGRKDNEVHCM